MARSRPGGPRIQVVTPPVTAKPRLLWVGAFPPASSPVIGGFITSCRLLRQSSFAERLDLSLVDSTQPNNPPPGLLRRAWLAAGRVLRYVKLFERRRPDAVLLFASATRPGLAERGLMAWYARWRGAAVLLFPRGVLDAGGHSRRGVRWLRGVFGGAHMVLCQGAAWHDFVTERLGFAAADAPVIPNWTAEAAHIAIARARQERDDPNGARRVRVVFVGWVTREKGMFELIEACRALRGSVDFELAVVGDGVAAPEIRDLITRSGLNDRVRMTGWLRGAALLSEYASADVFVLPSWAEGLPNAMIEAMASGLASVVSSVGAVPGLVTDGDQALLVPPRDVAALRVALERVIGDHALRRRLGLRAAAWAAEHFGVETAANSMVDAVQRAIVLAGKPGRRAAVANDSWSAVQR